MAEQEKRGQEPATGVDLCMSCQSEIPSGEADTCCECGSVICGACTTLYLAQDGELLCYCPSCTGRLKGKTEDAGAR